MSDQLDILKGDFQLLNEVLDVMQAPRKSNQNPFSRHRDIPVWQENDPKGQAYYTRCAAWDNRKYFRELIRHNLRIYLRSCDLSGLVEYKPDDLPIIIARRLVKKIRKERRLVQSLYDRLNSRHYMRLWWALGAELIMAGADIKTTEGPLCAKREHEYDDLEYKGRNRSWDEWGRQ